MAKAKPVSPVKKAQKKVDDRPAETAGLSGAAVLIVGRLLGIEDPDVLVALGVLFASVPAVVTWLVVKFGI